MRDGFVVMRGFFSGRDLVEILRQVDRFVRDVVPRVPRERVFFEDRSEPRSLKQIQHMGAYDPWFRQLAEEGPPRALAERLLDGPVVPMNLQYFDKPAGHSLPTPPHQDGHYFMLDPCEAVTLWLALDRADEETGCVRYVRGSHREGLRPHSRTTTLGFSQGLDDWTTDDEGREVAMVAEPGDLIAHHALTIHRSDANRSATRSRRALGFIYYSARAREDVAAHAAYQARLAEDLSRDGRV